MSGKMQSKICKRCHKNLDLSCFYVDTSKTDNRVSYCKACKSSYDKARRFRAIDKIRAYDRARYVGSNADKTRAASRASYNRRKDKWRARQLLKDYGISLAQYRATLVEQGYKCAFCASDIMETGNNTNVDHDHRTGRVRGIVCSFCNGRIIGANTLDTARKLIHYLSSTTDLRNSLEVLS